MSYAIVPNSLFLFRGPKSHHRRHIDLVYKVREANGAEYKVLHLWHICCGHSKRYMKAQYANVANLNREMLNQATYLEKQAHGKGKELTAAELNAIKYPKAQLSRICIKKAPVVVPPKAIVIAAPKPVVAPPKPVIVPPSQELIAQNKALEAQIKLLRNELAEKSSKLQTTVAELNKVLSTLKTVEAQHAVILGKLASIGL